MFQKRKCCNSILIISAALVLILVCLSYWFDWDDKAYYRWMEWHASDEQKESAIWLPDYRVDVQALQIQDVDKNVSGITYDYDNDTLWIITNQPQELIELNMTFAPVRRILLENFSDTEAVAYVGNNTFVIADERDFSIVVAPINAQTKALNRKNLRFITLKQGGSDNNGLEGLAFDAKAKVIYAVQERNPLKLISVSGLVEGTQGVAVGVPAHIDINDFNLDDLSGLHFDAKTGHLLLLSDEAKLLAEVSNDGHAVSYFDLEAGFNGLHEDIPQAEGVTLDAQGNLYIISEPNLFYRFTKISP
ncbi:MAG: SdiA-regulated domain-containing protein [Halodesulfovibrio sp.]|uniref:SdiA-regulated domain-containing protein n=1 Tax=Halodesulfovibrio sp. TaxID=1912772 RepID=UPI00359E4DA7